VRSSSRIQNKITEATETAVAKEVVESVEGTQSLVQKAVGRKVLRVVDPVVPTLSEFTVANESVDESASVSRKSTRLRVDMKRQPAVAVAEVPFFSTGCSSPVVPPAFTGAGVTRKFTLSQNSKKELSALEKEFLPKSMPEQVDSLHDKLKAYHDEMKGKLDNVTTVRLSPEVVEVLKDIDQVDDEKRKFTWSKEEEVRFNNLNEQTKELKARENWYWRSDKGYSRCQYNDKRMAFCVERELVHRIVHCPQCKSTGLLVGLNQIHSTVCYDCLTFNNSRSLKDKKEKNEAWDKVRPESQDYPKRVERGFENEDLPRLFPGDKAVIAPVHPIVTVKKNFLANRRLRQESISIEQDPLLHGAKSFLAPTSRIAL
jgi:hypothetical protein